jgi:2-desacetyl-2-hydroxyethyl bacteriochlorophyllide A dehydrogenase
MTETMRALVWEGPRAMSVKQIGVPAVGVRDVLIEVAHAGICGSELSGYLGQSSLRSPPLVMGHEFAGTIAQVGGAVEGVSTGERVTVNPLVSCGRCDRCAEGRNHLCPRRALIGAHRPGAFAQFVAVPEVNVHALPAALGLATAALAEPLACAVHACRLAQVAPGQRLAIIGAGPIGLLVLVTARLLGVEDVVVSDTNEVRLGVANGLGAVTVPEREADVGLAPASFDVVVDAVGVDVTRRKSVELVRAGGAVAFCGLHEEVSPLPVNLVVRNELTLHGSFAYAPRDFENALGWLGDGRVELSAWITHADLSEGRACFEKLLSDPGGTIKVLLNPSLS